MTTTVVVAGALANKTGNGGEAWVRLAWAIGLRRLGLDVHLVERMATHRCVTSSGAACGLRESAGADFFRRTTDAFGLSGAATLFCDGAAETVGLPHDELTWLMADADALVNVSGHLGTEGLPRTAGRRVYVDLDPGYTQLWHAEGLLGDALSRHEHHYSVGQNVGTPACPLPTAGVDWRPVRPPVLIDEWPVAEGPGAGAFTTVASWRGGYGTLSLDDRTFGPKAHAFRRARDLPSRMPAPLEVALDIHPGDDADRRALIDAGWRLVDPAGVAATPEAFRDYVAGSTAEFSVAQPVYSALRTGWLSDRTAHYLASGRPALVEDTGVPDSGAGGLGLVTFADAHEAPRAAHRILGDYEEHREAARALAKRVFASDVVLARVAEEVGLVP